MKTMIKKIYILTLLLFAALGANAQVAGGKIEITNLVTVETAGEVVVMFDAYTAKRTVAKTQTYTFVPVLTDGNYRVSLPAIVIRGGKDKVGQQRRAWAAGETPEYPVAAYTTNNRTVNYTARVAAQAWMQGGKLGIEGVMAGCCTVTTDPMVILAENLKLYDEPQDTVIVTEVRRFVPRTVADSLSMTFPFVLPETMFDPEDPFKIYDEERESSMVVYFHQSKYDIDRNLRDNNQTLKNLTAAIEMILRDNGSKVQRVVVAGFASPEGSYDFNDQLAFNRAVAVKRHLLGTTGIRDEQVWIYNGSVDWKGLRMLVEQSNMSDKQAILRIIDTMPIWDSQRQVGRLGELMRLKGGDPYRYMLREMFPLLRNGAFIKVYYTNE